MSDIQRCGTNMTTRSLTELCNGNIGMTSELGVGSTFAFFVGTRVSTLCASAVGTEHPEPTGSYPVKEILKTSSVLIVEDNLVNV